MAMQKITQYNSLPKTIKTHKSNMQKIISMCKVYLAEKKILYDIELEQYMYKLKSMKGRKFVNCEPADWDKVYK